MAGVTESNGNPVTYKNPMSVQLAEESVMGDTVVGPRISQVATDFSRALANSDVTSAVTSTGVVSQGSGQVSITSGAGVTATASLKTNATTNYLPGREIYAFFTAAFTTPTSANSEQRIGIYNATDGFFIGYHGLQFGITIRRNSVDTFIASSSFSEDTLDGNAKSLFTRLGVPEAINHSLLNVFGIQFAWLGGAVIHFEVMSPDGHWVKFHTVRNPNTQLGPSILTPDLPITAEVTKTAADATALTLYSSSWDAGIVGDPLGLGPEDVRGNKYRDGGVANQAASGVVYTVSAGRRFKCTSMIVNVVNTAGTSGELDILDGVGGALKVPFLPAASTNQSRSVIVMNLVFPTPLEFVNTVYASIVSGTITYSISVVGYEVPVA